MSGMLSLTFASDATDAQRRASEKDTAFIAGGTDMLQRLEEHVLPPARLVALSRLGGLDEVAVEEDAVRIGARVTLNQVIEHETLAAAFPVLTEALSVTASPQVRNLATVGGNPLQKTRCLYYRDSTAPCNRREPGSGCGAMEGQNRLNAIFGCSQYCIATHASDMAVAMTALDAVVETTEADGGRTLPFGELHLVPGSTPEREYALEPGELIAGYRLQRSRLAAQSHYLKVRDRAEFEWALLSAAVAMELDGANVKEARIAAGGVGTKPWRFPKLEAALAGRPATPATFAEVAAMASEGAVTHGHNAYKVPLLQRTLERALNELREKL